MNAKSLDFLKITVAAGMVVLAGNLPVAAQETTYSAGTPPAVPTEELPAGSQVLTRGPVHEAFAKPVTMDPQTPMAVPNQPPEELQEMPPAERPAGAEIVWVPGYWAWDADRNDFIWVSGCWRQRAARNTYWVPGHWLQAGNGWEWIAGFWKPIAAQPQQEIEYLPAPPAAGRSRGAGIAASARSGLGARLLVLVEGHYVLRHGYWMVQHVGWVWVPSHYAWTPRGYIFCPGHWDYDLDDRGVLFAPAYFPPGMRVQAGFVFCPGICVDLGMLRLNLFVYPRYRHYFFGDYYDDAYRRVGHLPVVQMPDRSYAGTIRCSFTTAGTSGKPTRIGPGNRRKNFRRVTATATSDRPGRTLNCRPRWSACLRPSGRSGRWSSQ